MVSTPEGLPISMLGRLPATVVWSPSKIWTPGPLNRRRAVPPPVKPIRAWTSPWAANVPVAATWLSVPLNSSVAPAAVRVVPAASVTVAPDLDRVEGVRTGDRAAGEDEGAGPSR